MSQAQTQPVLLSHFQPQYCHFHTVTFLPIDRWGMGWVVFVRPYPPPPLLLAWSCLVKDALPCSRQPGLSQRVWKEGEHYYAASACADRCPPPHLQRGLHPSPRHTYYTVCTYSECIIIPSPSSPIPILSHSQSQSQSSTVQYTNPPSPQSQCAVCTAPLGRKENTLTAPCVCDKDGNMKCDDRTRTYCTYGERVEGLSWLALDRKLLRHVV